jgi:hypothetical protein
LDIGNDLGQWGIDEYDEMLYLQNGVYHRRLRDEWLSPKARGLDVASVAQPIVEQYLRNLAPGDFPALTVQMRERFVGLNAAYVKGRGIHVKEHLGKWEAGSREMEPGGKGKRMHMSKVCAECNMGVTAWDHSHRLAIHTRSLGELSTPHNLPWENVPVPDEMAKFRELDAIAEDMILL